MLFFFWEFFSQIIEDKKFIYYENITEILKIDYIYEKDLQKKKYNIYY